MKETGVFFGNLVQDLAQLREAAVSGLQSLQAEQQKLEEEIKKAQERHQTVRESQVPHQHKSEAFSRFAAGRAARNSFMHCILGQRVRLLSSALHIGPGGCMNAEANMTLLA